MDERDERRRMSWEHMPGPLEPTWTERRERHKEFYGGLTRGQVAVVWAPCAVLFALGAYFDWEVPGWFGAPVALMATLGFFWMLASPTREQARRRH